MADGSTLAHLIDRFPLVPEDQQRGTVPWGKHPEHSENLSFMKNLVKLQKGVETLHRGLTSLL